MCRGQHRQRHLHNDNISRTLAMRLLNCFKGPSSQEHVDNDPGNRTWIRTRQTARRFLKHFIGEAEDLRPRPGCSETWLV